MNDTQAVRLGRLLAQVRRNKSLSLRAVAERANVAHLWLSRVEQGHYNQPAPERITRVIEVLGIDPERIDRITKGHVSSNLPNARTYFRAKYGLSPDEISEVERKLEDINRQRWLDGKEKI
jgi:transcriptional regulator with XRE-family HTH domain